MKKMTNKERMLTAMRGGTPDRVPCSPDTNWTIPQRLLDVPSWDIYYYNKPPIWKAYNDSVKYFGIDGFSHHGYYDIPLKKGSELKNEEIFSDGKKLIVRTTFSCPKGILTQEETYFRDEPPTPTKKWIDNFVEEYDLFCEYFFGDMDKINFDEYKKIQSDMGDNGVVGLCMLLPTLLTQWRQPTEAAFYDYFDHHELLSKFIDRWTEYLVQIAHKIVDSDVNPDFIFFPNSGAITMQSEDIMSEYTFPALKKLTSIFKKAGILTSLHSCGKENLLVKLAAEQTDLDCIDPLEVAPMGDCNLMELKQKYGDRIALKGNLPTTDVMLFMDEKGIEKEAIKCLEDGKEGGGFILSTGDQCGRNTPDANIFKLLEVCEKYGKY